MRLKERHILDLDKVVAVLSEIHGVAGVFLFGSFARGDYDEYSDYDLLVLFNDKTSMWGSWDQLFEAVGALKMNLHVIPETLEELKAANPVFLDELSRHGKIIFSRLPFEVFVRPVKLESFCLIFYDMSRLSYKDKMKAVYFLYKKDGSGAVAKTGGIKLGDGCIIVPSVAGSEIIEKLRAFSVETRRLEIYVTEDQLRAMQAQS